MLERDRPVQSDEIVVTQEMIEAGVREFLKFVPEDMFLVSAYEDIVASVFVKMREQQDGQTKA